MSARNTLADITARAGAATPEPWARPQPEARPDRRTDLRRKVNIVIADLIRWSVEHGDGLASPQPGLMYVTTNELLAETMHAARPDAVLYRRPVSEWTRVDGEPK